MVISASGKRARTARSAGNAMMASPTSSSRGQEFSCCCTATCIQLSFQCGGELTFRGENKIDHGNINRKNDFLRIADIAGVLFGRDEGDGACALRFFHQVCQVAIRVVVMVAEYLLPGYGHVPASKIIKKRLRVADATKGKEGAVANFAQVVQVIFVPKTAKTQQSRLGVEDGKRVRVARFDFGPFRFTRHHQDIGAVTGDNRLAQRSRRKQPLVLQLARTVNHQYIEIARERKMLEAVVKQKNINWLLGFETLPFFKAILANAENSPVLQAILHQLDLVTRAAGTSITSTKNRDALPFRKKFLREPENHRRFPCPAHGQVANANYFALQSLLFQPALRIDPGAKLNVCAVQKRERPE